MHLIKDLRSASRGEILAVIFPTILLLAVAFALGLALSGMMIVAVVAYFIGLPLVFALEGPPGEIAMFGFFPADRLLVIGFVAAGATGLLAAAAIAQHPAFV